MAQRVGKEKNAKWLNQFVDTIPTKNAYLKGGDNGSVSWAAITTGGDVVGPAGVNSADDVAVYDGATGKAIKDSKVKIDAADGNIRINGRIVSSDPGADSGDPTKYQNANGAWSTPAGGAGDVVGPAGATDDAIAVFDTATGKLLQNSVFTISGNDLSIAGNLAIDGDALGGAGALWLDDTGHFTAPAGAGTYIGAYDYIIFTDGVDYTARNCRTGADAYGGAADAGGVDGADFQAVCNAAIAACNAIATCGGHIFVMPGVYTLDGTITMLSNVTFECSRNTYISGGAAPGFHLITAASRTNFSIIGGIWDMNTPGDEYYQWRLEECSYFNLLNGYFQSDAAEDAANTTGINFYNSSIGLVANNYIYKGRIIGSAGGATKAVSRVRVEGNHLYYPPKQGICFYTATAGALFDVNTIVGNYVEEAYNDGICHYLTNATATSHCNTITGNTCRNCGRMTDQPAIGVSIGPAPNGPSYGDTITGNAIYDDDGTNGRGIGCYGGYAITITGNGIYGCRMNGISLIRTQGESVVTGNTIHPTASAALGVGGGGIWMYTCTNTIISGNTIKLLAPSATADCIYMSGCDYCIINGNIMNKNGGANHIALDATCDMNIVSHNRTMGGAALLISDAGTKTKQHENWGTW